MRYYVASVDLRPLIVPLVCAEMLGFLFIGSFVAAADRDPYALVSSLAIGICVSIATSVWLLVFGLLYRRLAGRFGYASVVLSRDLPLLDADASDE